MTKRFLIDETKGLMKGLERAIFNARFELSKDNMTLLTREIDYFKGYIEQIEAKIEEYRSILKEEDDDELY